MQFVTPACFGGWLLRIAGFAGSEAQVATVVKMAVIDDTQALRELADTLT